MIDREKTIRDLKTLGAWHTHHYEPFHYECAETIHNALELLKEQESVKPPVSIDAWIGMMLRFYEEKEGNLTMINRNEVIEWLKNCVYDMPYCDECPYNDHIACKHFLMKDVIVLLKEQEPVKPVIAKYCGICGTPVKQKTGDAPGWKYCPNCGRAVKWE